MSGVERTKRDHGGIYNAFMRARRGLTAIYLAVLSLWSPLMQGPDDAGSLVLHLRATGPITPAMAEYLDRGLAEANSANAELVLFSLDTPGGAIDTMNRMVQSIRASRVPVAVYIEPRGAIAGSAGTVITLAGHVAAMAPETAIGAASPVGGQGEDLGETIEAKEKEILKATVRSLASRRGSQAVQLAEETIDEARAVSSQEALEAGLIDFVAEDAKDLLVKLDGFEVETVTGEIRLSTSGASIRELPQTPIEQLLQALTNPNLVFLLLAIGVQAILIELSSPGGWVAGFIGLSSLVLAVYGLGVLPVNWVGMIFVLTAFVLFLLEIKAATHGALAAVGIGSLIMGGLVLFNSPGNPAFARISVPALILMTLVIAATFLIIIGFALRAQRKPIETGRENLVGRLAMARSDLNPQGSIQLRGEIWTAVLDDRGTVSAGEMVEIVAVQGLKVVVRPARSE